MKIIRKGNVRGLDKDYTVYVDSVDEVIQLHTTLLSKGFLFMYQKGDVPFDPHTKSMYILHYIDKNLMLYDYAIFFPDTIQSPKKPKEFESELDKSYKKAQSNPAVYRNLMKFMKFHKLLSAFRKHLKAYDHMSNEHIQRFNEVLENIKKQTGLELSTITPDSIRGLDVRIKHFFDI
jgi:hypothetical protein